jgi:hypothetical protein
VTKIEGKAGGTPALLEVPSGRLRGWAERFQRDPGWKKRDVGEGALKVKSVPDASDAGRGRARALRTKTFIVLALAVIAGALGNVFLSRGMKLAGDFGASPGGWLRPLASAFFLGEVWVGIGCLILFLLLYLAALSWADLSYVLPSSAVGYIAVALLAHFAVGERVSVLRWFGTFTISMGVLLVGGTPPRTTAVDPDDERGREDIP